jgi:hypothetical protein
MKKYLALLALTFLSFSCSKNDDEDFPNYTLELQPITLITIPDTFEVGATNDITLSYNRKTTCHGFNQFYYAKAGLTRTVAVEDFVLEKNDCSNLTNATKLVTLKFKPIEPGMYTFKFYKGKDAAGVDIFETIIREAL